MVLQVRALTTCFHTRQGLQTAVDGVSFDVAAGEIVALVGESGCGKTVSALSVMRLIPEPPGKIAGGQAIFGGRDLLQMSPKDIQRVRGREIAMVFQDPMSSLNPVLTIGRQIGETLREHMGMTKAEAQRESVRLLDLMGIPNPGSRLDQYPHQFSGGMRQRVMLAIALSCRPRLLIADEPTTAVDVTIQAQLLELIYALSQQFQMAVLLVTHNLGLVAKYAHRVNVMYAGRIVEQAPMDEIYTNPRHPYTRALLRCVPRLDEDRQLVPIEGQPPDFLRLPSGCAFHPRCSFAIAKCRNESPRLNAGGQDHNVACLLANGR